jgi:hypothetical protein
MIYWIKQFVRARYPGHEPSGIRIQNTRSMSQKHSAAAIPLTTVV